MLYRSLEPTMTNFINDLIKERFLYVTLSLVTNLMVFCNVLGQSCLFMHNAYELRGCKLCYYVVWLRIGATTDPLKAKQNFITPLINGTIVVAAGRHVHSFQAN